MQQVSKPMHFPADLPALPTGSVTLLFSDIEGSTARWERYPEAMHEALRKHDELMLRAVSLNNGHVFKNVGDEVCAVFQRASDAVAGAVAAQRALTSEDWSSIGGLRVRMALHSGTTQERDGDYFGPNVNKVARLLPAGYGGQILISATSAPQLQHEIPEEIALRDLGRHRLKDFPDLESIYQIVAPDLPDIFPPLKTIAERPSNLPQQLASLVGREDDVHQIEAFLQEHRIVSILGTGGVGKTSLALQIGTDLLPSYEDGVWYVELAPIADANSVVLALAGVLQITGAGSGSVLDAITAYLKNKSALVVIDNCEHVIEAAGQLVHKIVSTCPNVRFLATSREPLAVAGEHGYRLPTLAVPPEHVLTAAEASTYASVELFAQRARAHVPSFVVTDENAPTVAVICRHLDGIALAIELAAPRLRMLGVEKLAEKLSERFRVLTGGSRTALPRQQTMRALIDWSYDLLSEPERTLMRRVAAFAGGWTFDAAVNVCSDDRFEEWEILERLTSLVDKSLVVADASGSEPRYRMLESTREYALERLGEDGERDAIVRRHAEHYLQVAKDADETWSDTNAREWIAPLAAELDNFRAALVWAIAKRADEQLGISLFSALQAFWWDTQPIEGRRWITDAMDIVGSLQDRHLAARFWLTAASVALTLRQQKAALEHAERACESYREIGEEVGVAAARRCRGHALINLGHVDEGEVEVSAALEVFRAHANRRLTALALRSLGAALTLRGELDRAAPIYREALKYAQTLGDERGVQIVSANLAEVEFGSGDYEHALEHGLEALELARSKRDRVYLCGQLINVCAYLLALDRFEDARSTAREALLIAREIESDLHLGIAVQHLGAISAAIGDPSRAARLLGYSDAAYRSAETSREPTEQKAYERSITLLIERVGVENFALEEAEGSQFRPDSAVAEALLV